MSKGGQVEVTSKDGPSRRNDELMSRLFSSSAPL